MMTTTTTRHVTTVLGLSVLGLATLTGCSTEEQGTDTSANAPAEQSADSGTEANNQNAGADADGDGLPEGQEDDELDGEDLEEGLVRREVFGVFELDVELD